MRNFLVLWIAFWTISIHLYADEAVRTLKDSDGKEVVVPLHVKRVVPLIGAFAQVTGMLGKEHTMVATVPRLSTMFYTVFPSVEQKSSVGNPSVNIEAIIAAQAQVVYGPTAYFLKDTQIAQLKSAGVAVVNVANFSTIEEMKESITLIGEILGEDAPQTAKLFNDYYDAVIARVQAKTQTLSPKLKVLTLNFSAGSYTTLNDSDIGSIYVKIAGGVNVAADYALDSKGIAKTLNGEQVLVWNPDVIVTYSRMSQETILSNPAFQTLNAVKNRRVYVVPTGVYLWAVRSAEGALEPLWLAKTLYPDLFQDLSLENEARRFYRLFYRYDVSDEEIKTILKGA